MIRIEIKKTSPLFVAAVKAELSEKKKRFERYFSIISFMKNKDGVGW